MAEAKNRDAKWLKTRGRVKTLETTLGQGEESAGKCVWPHYKLPEPVIQPCSKLRSRPPQEHVKHLHDEKTLELKATEHLSRAYPLPYGFVLNTTAEDGDNVDYFVLTKTHVKTGTILDCDAIGLMEQIEDGEVDHKVLAVIHGECETLDDATKQMLGQWGCLSSAPDLKTPPNGT